MIYRGVRVVELASGIAGPYATMFLADHGADVVKVEPPDGDPYRAEPGFQTFNRNKRSVVVDDPTPLVATADVVVTDRPGRLAELRRAAPGAVIVSLPPWGERGPLVDAPATPDLLAAATGIMWNQQSYAEGPVHIVVPFVPYATGCLGALALATGLYARAAHGWAPTYEVSEVAGAAALQLEQFRLGDVVEERDGSAPMGSKGRVPIYRLFRAGDDRWFFLACGTVRFYERLLELIGRPELRHHPLLPDPPWGLMALDAVAFIAPILEEAFETKPRDEWLRLLRAADIPAQPVQSRAEFLASPLCAANRLDVEIEHPELGTVAMMGVPVVMEAAPGGVTRPAPRLGEHTAEVLAEPPRAAPPPGPPGDRAPLAGVRAVDLSSFIAGPVVSRHLAMLGADVVKVESPAGDPFRAFGPAFANWNQGKRSIVLDLTSPAGREVLDRLVDRSDIVIENFRPGVAERLGADHRRLRSRKPDLVFLSSPGYGDDETLADAPAFDPLMQCLGGLMYAQGGLATDGSGFGDRVEGAEPVFLTVPIHDVVTPILGAFGLVSALYHRARTGEAQRVRTSLAQATVAVQAAELTRYAGAPPTLAGGFDFRGPSEDRCCVEADGDWWFQDGPHRAPIVRHGLVNEPIAVDNGLLVTHDHPTFGPLTAFGQLVQGAGPAPVRAPLLDEHRDEIMAELGS